jgi:hypothetical protein
MSLKDRIKKPQSLPRKPRNPVALQLLKHRSSTFGDRRREAGWQDDDWGEAEPTQYHQWTTHSRTPFNRE